MLSLTPRAVEVIHHLLDSSDLPQGAGLRIAQREDHPALAMTLADGAQPDDTVVRDQEAVVFVEPMAAMRVGDRVLDAEVNETRRALYLRD